MTTDKKEMKIPACIILSLFLSVQAFGQDFGNIEKITIHSKELNQNREFFVYTPSYYEESKWKYYDVIYVFDAQNRQFFDLTHSLLPFVSSEIENPYIVVGLIATYDEELNYGRNDDLLPKPVNVTNSQFFGHGNSDAFLKYIKKELVPYVEQHYRTLSKRIAVGHSLSASFVISALLKESNIFDSYISISPNFTYDKDRLADEFTNHDFTHLESQKFMYISNADEGIDYWKSWSPAREKVYTFLNDTKPDSIIFKIDDLPDYNHWTTFVPGLINGLKSYHGYLENLPERTYETTITVTVPDKSDEVYITGNQEVLGDWDESKIKMTRVSELERSITLNLHANSQIRFTRGSAETEAVIKDYDLEYLYQIPISPSRSNNYRFDIVNWKDRLSDN